MKTTLLIALLTAPLLTQSVIPAGTILPVRLNSSLNSRKIKVGQLITARLMQDVLLEPRTKIRAGAKVMGHVVAVERANDKLGARVSIRFETLAVSRKKISIAPTNLRAIASMMDVEEAQVPLTGPDRGTSESSWTTEQIGGEVVYRGGTVANGLRSVGEPTYNGVLVRVSSKAGTDCRADAGDSNRLQALWLFSSDACGTYGFADLKIAHAGRTDPMGEITLAASHGDINVRSGSGMLLRVNHKSVE